MSVMRSDSAGRCVQPMRWAMVIGLLVVGWVRTQAAEPFFFIQLTDPQFGMWTSDADCQQETVNFEFAIATANRLKPAFVIVTGDLINKTGDQAQSDEYLRIAAKLDRSIPLYNVAGNHDLGNTPTPETMAAYATRFGKDYYVFHCGPLMGIVLNSCLLKSPENTAPQAAQHAVWLQRLLEDLAKGKPADVRHVVVFQHHPWFSETIDEPDGYNNLPLPDRRRYLDLFRQGGVTHVLAGHYHANRSTKYEALELVASAAIGKPLSSDGAGLRVVVVRDTGIEHRFYHMGEIPNQIDLATK